MSQHMAGGGLEGLLQQAENQRLPLDDALRIADQAQGGEILVSSLLKEVTESAGDIRFGEGREVELKGLAGTHRVHSIEWKER